MEKQLYTERNKILIQTSALILQGLINREGNTTDHIVDSVDIAQALIDEVVSRRTPDATPLD